MNRSPLKPHALTAVDLLLSAALVFVLWGCSRPAPKTSDQFFVKWLEGHGESNVVVDAKGVGIKGNPTRLRCSLYGSEQHTNHGFNAELEFRVRMPDGREIVEYVAGMGDSLEKAESDARMNFLISTFHVIYRSFLNPADPHQTEEKVVIQRQPRLLVLGDTITRSQTTNGAPDMSFLREGFREILASASLSPQTHWIKVVYANHHSNMMMCALTLDNQDNPALTESVKSLNWPRQDEFYMVKQFMVIK